ncbi:hypothetical protein JCM11641_005016 [Rhodosporidiobolus odoratus]
MTSCALSPNSLVFARKYASSSTTTASVLKRKTRYSASSKPGQHSLTIIEKELEGATAAMMSFLSSLRRRTTPIKAPSDDPADQFRPALVRREKLLTRLVVLAPRLRSLLILAGLLYTLALPYHGLGRKHYISENALQPGHVNTYWNWADVHVADLLADNVAKWSADGVTVDLRTKQLHDAFQELGLSASRQSYTYTLSPNSSLSGTNTFAILPAPKTDGAEALVLSASWLSRALDEHGNRRINTRGVALVLALANYFKKYSMWSKDIIFVISDGYSEGMQAWLDSYHRFEQSNLEANALKLTTGAIWASLSLDYPHHSFSHVGIFYEGANGQLPNLDFVNAASRILRHSGITPLLHSYDPSSRSALPSLLRFLPFASHPEVQRYSHAFRNLFHQVALGADGRVSGPEGAAGKYRIDSITLFGVPAEGPHGFHSLGRATESLFRSLNNLLERFHQSFFLYLMTTVDSFIAVGNYLAAPILVGAGLTVQGLLDWAEAGKVSKEGRYIRTVAGAAGVAVLAKVAELTVLQAIEPLRALPSWLSPVTFGLQLAVPLLTRLVFVPQSFASPASHSLHHTLRSLSFLSSGLLISITATLNFGLSVFLSLYLFSTTLFIPSMFRRYPPRFRARRQAQQLLMALLSPTGIWAVWRVAAPELAERWMSELVLSWKVGGGWSVPVVLLLVGPIVTLRAMGALL